jgi:hypothetical protein
VLKRRVVWEMRRAVPRRREFGYQLFASCSRSSNSERVLCAVELQGRATRAGFIRGGCGVADCLYTCVMYAWCVRPKMQKSACLPSSKTKIHSRKPIKSLCCERYPYLLGSPPKSIEISTGVQTKNHIHPCEKTKLFSKAELVHDKLQS